MNGPPDSSGTDPMESLVQRLDKCLHRLRESQSNDAVSVREIVAAFEDVPDLRQRIIGEANAASTGAWRRIDDVHHAATRLGLQRVEQILALFTARERDRSAAQSTWVPHYRPRAPFSSRGRSMLADAADTVASRQSNDR